MARDVKSSLKRQVTYEKQFLHHPLLIMNGFSGDARELQLTSSMFQNMFPSINVSKVKLGTIKRCVLLNRDEETGNIEFRHYTIKLAPVGLSKGIKKIATGKIPNLGRYEDMSEFLNSRGGQTSESEGEEDETSRVTLPQGVSARGNLPQEQSAIRLIELGPRINMKLMKIEEGLFDGEVMYHSLIEKTEEEKKAIRAAREKQKKEKEKRRKEQEQNVKKKEKAKADHKEKSLAGMQKKLKDAKDLPKGFEGLRANENDEDEEEDDDDEEYYRQEVGKAPDKELFDKGSGGLKRRASFKDNRFKKKRKVGEAPSNRGRSHGPRNSGSDRFAGHSRGSSRGGGRGGARGGSRGGARGGARDSSGPRRGPAKFKITMKKPMNSKRNVKHSSKRK